jgi:hypothetical protein
MSHPYDTAAAAARKANCSVAYLHKLRKSGVITPPRASDGTFLYSDVHIEAARARAEAWRNRPRKAKAEVRPVASTRGDVELRPSLAGRKGI